MQLLTSFGAVKALGVRPVGVWPVTGQSFPGLTRANIPRGSFQATKASRSHGLLPTCRKLTSR